MRTVLPSSEVYHLWANERQPHARNSSHSVSFEGDTAYSYRAPIARIVRNDAGQRAVLFSPERYSVTTSGHQSRCRRAIPHGVPVFHVPFLNRYDATTRNIMHYQSSILELQGKAKRARSAKAYRQGELLDLITEARAYAVFFGLSADLFSEHDLAALAERANAAQATEREAEKVRAKQRAERMREAVPRWMMGEAVDLFAHPETFLRLSRDGQEVETSRGARVPVAEARQLFAAWAAGRVEAGMTVGNYTVISSTRELLTIGCHQLNAGEILRLAVVEKWWPSREVAA